MSIGQRISELVDHFSYGNVSKFAAKIGYSEANVRNYINGTQPKIEFLSKVADIYEINSDWLLLGNGPMLKTQVPRSLVEAVLPEELLNQKLTNNMIKEKCQEGCNEIMLLRLQLEEKDKLLAEKERTIQILMGNIMESRKVV